jgi:hypothetical protein
LEHPTATSLLLLRCFKSFIHLVFFTYIIKSNHQGRISLASAKPDPPSGARRGEPPLRQNFPRKSFLPKEKFSTKTTFDYIDNETLKTSERARKRQGQPSRGTPTPPGYGYLTHHLPRKVTHARISGSIIEQVLNAWVENDFRAFDYIDSRVLKMTRVHVSGKANRAEGLLRLWDTNTSLITFHEK